jgi:hypothetical protein
VAGTLPSEDAGTQKRRSTRIVQAIPIFVSGVDALGQPFKERTTTVMVNCHGCKYQSKHYVPKNSTIILDIPSPESGAGPRTVQGRVIWVQRPRAVRELFQIGLEFEVAGNVWGIAFPPEDWFPLPGEEVSAAPAPPETVPTGPTAVPAESKLQVVPSSGASPESQIATAFQISKLVGEAKENLEKNLRRGAQTAINEEMTVVRQQLDEQLHDAVEKAIKLSMERVSESAVKKVVQQAADRTAAIVEDARKTSEAGSAQLDAKIRSAVDSAVGQAAEHAAQHAAQQVTAQNMKQAVEEAVARVVSQRQAETPSLGILASPEAAQQHLDSWKKSLEEAAQAIRSQTLDQAQTDAAAVRGNWQREFDAGVASASQNLGQKLAEAAQAALSEQQARAQEARTQIEDAGRAAVDQTRQKLDEMLSAQQQEASRRTDQAIAERMQSLEPSLQASAQQVVERLTQELDQSLSSKTQAARKATSDLAEAHEQASQLENRIRDQVQRALDQAAQIEASVREQTRIASEQASQLQSTVREQVQQSYQQALQESIELVKQQSGTLPANFEESCRAALARLESELEQKSTEAQHETFEALSKAADWYQKKAQTTMQSTLEKAVEQSTTTLRGRAAEISSLVASELDHYRRSYVDHSRGEIEEAAKEVVERERGRISESADTAHAGFADRVNQTTDNSLRRFEDASRQSLEKARSDMEYARDASLGEFQKILDEKMARGTDQANLLLQSQLGPLLRAWEAKRQQEQQEWIERLKQSTDESIEQYKARLENASNSWLLTSATTLGQHSQAVLDTLAKSAEKRMREAIADVLAGMGDTLKDRLLGISSNFGAEDEDENPPKKKK